MLKKVPLPFCKDLCTPMPRRKRSGGLLALTIVEDPSWNAEWDRRLALLFEHYRIDTTDPKPLYKLLFSLLRDFVPGLEEPKPSRRGRPRTKSTPEARDARRHLLEAVEEKKRGRPGLKDTDACRHVAKDWAKWPPDHVFAVKSADYLSRQLAAARREREADRRLENFTRAFTTGNSSGMCLPLNAGRVGATLLSGATAYESTDEAAPQKS